MRDSRSLQIKITNSIILGLIALAVFWKAVDYFDLSDWQRTMSTSGVLFFFSSTLFM